MIGGNDARRDGNSVTTLVGVSNVDFQKVVPLAADPLTGRILVDLSGGVYPSSLALEIPTGAVNGLNTVFSVVNNPLFEEVSGQVMVNQTQDSTNYGYTISGTGPYTITFTNAPTQTPHSFYTITSSGAAVSSFFTQDSFTSTNGQTVFTASLTPVFVLGFIVNGQLLTLTTDYTQSGATFTLNSGIPAGLPVSITYIHA